MCRARVYLRRGSAGGRLLDEERGREAVRWASRRGDLAAPTRGRERQTREESRADHETS